MAESLLYGRADPMHAYIPASHPLYDADRLTEWPYDPATGNALLDEVGFALGEDGLRRHPVTDEPFRVTLATSGGNALRAGIGQLFQANMRDCGVEVVLAYQPSAQWFADGPEGDLFGRRYDLALFAWLVGVQPACRLYMADRIPGPPNMFDDNGDPLYPAGWGGDNNSGWRNEPFTAACQTAQNSLPGTAVYQSSHQEALRIFTEELPIIPLFTRLKLAAARPDLRHFNPDPTERSEMYNLWQFEFAAQP
jgi:peptide/nickel transport system substrate-binding protein